MMTVSSEPGDVQAERASRVDNMLVDFTDRAMCALERFLSEHKESGSAVMPKWFATLVLVIHAIAQWRGVKPMEFDRTSNEWETKRPNMRQRLEQERTDEDKLDAAYVKHKTNPADALKSVIGSPMGYLDDDMCDRATKLCIDILLLTETQGEEVDPSETIVGALTSDEDVGGVQAALQLLSHLTKDHRRACMLLKPKNCINTLLNVPRKFAFAAYDALASSILRHVVEDPEVLQAAMATEIHTILGDQPKINSRRFMPQAMPVISRDPRLSSQPWRSAASSRRAPEETRGMLGSLCIFARGTSTTRFARSHLRKVVWTPEPTSHPRTGRPTSCPPRPGR